MARLTQLPAYVKFGPNMVIAEISLGLRCPHCDRELQPGDSIHCPHMTAEMVKDEEDTLT